MTRPESQPRHPLALLADYIEVINEQARLINESPVPRPPAWLPRMRSLERQQTELDEALLSLDPIALRAQAEAEAGLREALAHYAELRHYDHAGRLWSGNPDEHEDAQVDFGEIARAALAQAQARAAGEGEGA